MAQSCRHASRALVFEEETRRIPNCNNFFVLLIIQSVNAFIVKIPLRGSRTFKRKVNLQVSSDKQEFLVRELQTFAGNYVPGYPGTRVPGYPVPRHTCTREPILLLDVHMAIFCNARGNKREISESDRNG